MSCTNTPRPAPGGSAPRPSRRTRIPAVKNVVRPVRAAVDVGGPGAMVGQRPCAEKRREGDL